jgi:hypothetical protein
LWVRGGSDATKGRRDGSGLIYKAATPAYRGLVWEHEKGKRGAAARDWARKAVGLCLRLGVACKIRERGWTQRPLDQSRPGGARTLVGSAATSRGSGVEPAGKGA